MMASAEFKEYTLFCPVCKVNFKQLIVLHKLPKNFNVDRILANAVESHNHQAYQDAQAQKNKAAADQQEPDKT